MERHHHVTPSTDLASIPPVPVRYRGMLMYFAVST